MVARKQVDWESIERRYRAGQMSNRMLAEEYGVSEGMIRKRARKEGWTKDLSDTVRKAVRSELVRTEVRTPHATEREVIETAAATGATVVRTHRKDIRTAAELVSLLMGQLIDAAQSREELENIIEEETKEDEGAQRRNRLHKAVSLPTHAATIRDLTTAAKNLVALERQAYNLDETNAEETYEERLKRLMGQP
jgi:hypothetical protein